MLQFLLRVSGLFLFWLGLAHATQIHLLPVGPVVADGKEEATLHIWVPHLEDGDKVKVKPAQGKLMDVIRKPGGILEVTWIPSLEMATRSVDVAVNLRKRGADPESANLPVTLVPPDAGNISLSATPGEWAPGQDAIQIKFTLEGTARQAQAARRILVSASVGTISEAMPLGDGTFSARWTPPAETLTARTVVISAVDAAAPSQIYGWTAFPLLANQSLSFGATPNSQNVLIVGDREYGPIKASPAGTVAFDALVHPQIRKGTLRSTLRDGRTLDVPAPLPLTEYPRVNFLPQPSSMPAGAAHSLLLVATTPEGAPLETATITVRANASTLGTATKTTTPGIYTLTVTPDQAGSIPLDAKMKDPTAMIGKIQSASSILTVIAPASRTLVSAEPTAFDEGASEVWFTAKTTTHAGAALANALPDFGTTGGEPVGRPINKKDGRYALKLKPTGDTLFAVAAPNMTASSLSPAHLVVWPAASAVDPGEAIPVLVAAIDAFGHPVPGVEIALSSVNAGTLSSPVTSANNGIAIATYTASSSPGLFTIQTTAAGLTAQASIFQGDEMAGPVPVKSGSALTIKYRDAVTQTIGTVRVDQSTPAPPPVVVAAPVVTAAPVAAAPVAAAVPAAVEPVATPKPAVTKAPTAAAKKPKKASSGGSSFLDFLAGGRGDIYFALIGSHHRFSQTADLPEEVEDETDTSPIVSGEPVDEKSFMLPPEANFTRGMSPGIRFGGDYWINDGSLALIGDTRLTFEKVQAGGRVMSFNSWSSKFGVKYRLGELGFGTPYIVGALQGSQTTLFKFKSKELANNTMEASRQGLFGASIGGGLVMPAGSNILIDAHISELFAMLPVQTNIGALVYTEVTPSIEVMTGLEFDFKHVSLKSGNIDVGINETEISLVAGLRVNDL